MNLPAHLTVTWTAPRRVSALCTTRRGGVSRDEFTSFNLAAHVGDDAEAVRINRERLRTSAGLPAEPVWLDQVHGRDVFVAEQISAGATPRADAAVTRGRGIPLVVLTADCLPILLCDMDDTVIAVAHAGWRGLAAGVIEATVAAMEVAPDRVLAWLGPAIGPQDYEVGDEVWDRFVARDWQCARCFSASDQQSWYADLFALARRDLTGAGVSRIFGGGVSTFADPERFFSFFGAMGAAAVWRA